MKSVVVIDLVRTGSGRGKPGGALSAVHPVDLLSVVLQALLQRNDLEPALVDDVTAGCAGQVGAQSCNVARNAVLSAGMPETVPGAAIGGSAGPASRRRTSRRRAWSPGRTTSSSPAASDR